MQDGNQKKDLGIHVPVVAPLAGSLPGFHFLFGQFPGLSVLLSLCVLQEKIMFIILLAASQSIDSYLYMYIK